MGWKAGSTTIAVLAALAVGGCRDQPTNSASPTSSQPSPAPTVAALSIEGTVPALGERSQFSATAILPNGTAQSVTTRATWQSANTSIATVTAAGMVTAVAAGTTEISATYEGVRATRGVTVVARAQVTVSGRVTDGMTGGALPNITVAILDGVNQARATTTDDRGQYALANLLAGSFTLSASAAGYATVSQRAVVTADSRLDLELPRSTSSGACPPITFSTLTTNLAAVATQLECGFMVEATQAEWFGVSTYGNPAPSLQFAASTPTTGVVRVTAGGRLFRFRSADLYSSVTPIPHVIEGTRGSAVQFTIQGTVPNTFGRFATVTNGQADLLIDALSIRITNPTASGSNPVGVDNIHVTF